ncbi:uncharacterized protein Dmoj_GI25698 [Drosophila mojavensis]|uniref:Uncharacterized protein n=1 Tax=Drosophila mojavensis TaxID=7230 RepID=A0A0Q9XEF9_DROMO|nr:uncharacterized protein Dmoj_GI25698 [Drosophila mojavensis]
MTMQVPKAGDKVCKLRCRVQLKGQVEALWTVPPDCTILVNGLESWGLRKSNTLYCSWRASITRQISFMQVEFMSVTWH